MKTKIKIFLVLIIAVLMISLGLIFAVNYKKGTVKYFYKDGYIINNTYETENSTTVDKIYFGEKASYFEHSNNQISFTNSNGGKAVINNESFVHYDDNSIMALKDGVAIDLDKIDSKLLGYYNIFSESVLVKTADGYEINNLKETLTFKYLLFKISNNKYLIGADNIIIAFSDDQTASLEGYAEIEYVNEDIIKIYNDKVSYQTIASDLYLVIDDVKINLEYKTIAKNNIKYLTMADMVINANDNIEVLKEDPKSEFIEAPETKDDEEESDNKNPNQGNNPDINSDIKDALDNISNIGGSNEQFDDEPNYIQPKFVVESLDVSALGFENFQVTLEDDSNVLYGNRTVELVENSSGKVVTTFDEWIEGNTSYSINAYNALKSNTEYTINIKGMYKIDDVEYDRVFVSKIFRTLDFGLEITQDYLTDDSVSFAVYRKKSSNVVRFNYEITDSADNTICKGSAEYNEESNLEKVTCDEDIVPNSVYKLHIYKIGYAKENSTEEFELGKSVISYKLKSLKSAPNVDTELTYGINSSNSRLTLGIKGANDPNGGITSYTFKIYSNVQSGDISNLVYSSVKDKYSDLVLPIGTIDSEKESSFALENGKCYYATVDISFDDNEKTIIYSIPLGDENGNGTMCIGENSYPKVIGFDSNGNTEETISGLIKIDNTGSTYPAVSKYRVEVREKSGTILSQGQLINVQSIIEEGDNLTYLPVSVKNLYPGVEYVMDVYFVDGNNSIFIGKAYTKTSDINPIHIKLENLTPEEFKEDLYSNKIFAVRVNGNEPYNGTNVGAFDKVSYIKFELMGCTGSENENCKALGFVRTIPKDQDSLEDLKSFNTELDGPEKIVINSSEFRFSVSNYDASYDTYKLVASSEAKQGYTIPVVINDNTDEEKNKFELYINEMDPILNFKAIAILNEDGAKTLLNRDTIIGYHLNFEIISGVGKKSINKIYYKIIDGNCPEINKDITINDVENSEWTSVDISSKSFETTIETGKEISRGKTYCIQYLAASEDLNQSTLEIFPGTIGNEKIAPYKQEPKVTGYIKNYTGNTADFDLNINDPDGAIEGNKIYFMPTENPDERKELEIEDGLYKLKKVRIGVDESEGSILPSENGEEIVNPEYYEHYQLKIKEQLIDSEPVKDIVIYETENLGTVENYTFKLKVDNSQMGKLIFKIENDKNVDKISKIKINNTCSLSLIKEENNLTSEISLSDLEQNCNVEIKEGKVNLDSKVKIFYRNGAIVNYRSENGQEGKLYFIESKLKTSKYDYFNLTSNSISRQSDIVNAKIYNNIDINNKLSHSKGVGVLLDDDVEVSIREAKSYDVENLLDINGNPTDNTFEVSEVVTTSSIETVSTINGAKISFDILRGWKENAEIEIKLLDNVGNVLESCPDCEKVEILKVENDLKFNATFENLKRENNYKYSIVIKDNGKDVVTYNGETNKLNEEINISALKHLVYTSSNVNDNENYSWKYIDDNGYKLKHQRKFDFNFIVDTSKYELNSGQTMMYDIAARRGNEEITIEEAIELQGENTISYYYNELRNSKELLGQYNIIIKPYVKISNSEKIDLSENEIGSINITEEQPQITVQNSDIAKLQFAISDYDGILTECGENTDGKTGLSGYNINVDNLTTMPYTYLINNDDDNSNTYKYLQYNEIKNKASVDFSNKKIVMLELKNSKDDLVAYSPVPFAEKNTIIDLQTYFITNSSLSAGTYAPVIKYCTIENNQKKYYELKINPVEINKNAYLLQMRGIHVGNLFVITFDNPDREVFEKISHVEYQYKIHGTNDINKGSKDDLIFTVNTIDSGDTLYALPLALSAIPIQGNPKIASLDVSFYDNQNKQIATYSYVSKISD